MAEQTNNRRRKAAQPLDPTLGHLQPQALEIEKAVLGALMIDKDAYAIVCEILRPESFYEPTSLRTIFTCLSFFLSQASIWQAPGELGFL